MQYLVAKAVGLNSDQQAALNFILPAGEDELFLGILELTSDDAFTKGRQLLSDLGDFYLDQEGITGERLTSTFTKAKKDLEGVEFNLLLVVLSGKAMYLIKQGAMAAFLKRQGQLSSLLEVEGGQLISGFLSEGDRVFLATVNLMTELQNDLSRTMDLQLDSWEEEMSDLLSSGDFDSHGLAGLLVISQPIENDSIEKDISIPSVEELGANSKRFTFKLPTIPISIPRNLPSINGRVRLMLALFLILVILIGVGIKYKNMKEADALRAKAEGERQAAEANPPIGQKYEVSISEFLDLDLVKKGFKAQNLSLSDGKLVILDPNTKTLISIDLAKNSNQILAGKDQLGEASLASINGQLAFSYASDKGVVRVDAGNSKLTSVAKPDSDWGKITDLYAFAGNIYLLDSLTNQIWKYLPTENGYSDKRKYLADSVKVDLAGSLRMQIESSVYVLKQDGQILRLTRGEPDNFSLGGLDKGIKDPKSIFTSSETDNLYILDSGNTRVVVVNKTGEYQSQYLSDRLASASDLVVDEIGKKVYLLDNSKIYIMELR